MTKKTIKKKGDGKIKELENLRNQLARALADYDNLRKRTEAEREIWTKFAGKSILTKLFPVLDNLENAQKHLNDAGLAIAINQFKEVLGQEGLEEIKPQKEDKFDHEIHEALESIAGGKKGVVAETILAGWKYVDGPVLRFAKVKVYGKKVAGGAKEELEKGMARSDYM